MTQKENKAKVTTQVKNPELVKKRHRQIVDAAVQLFIKNGFHKTTTREIAKAVGFSIGSLYEYVASKEDILYLVCEAIHDEVESGILEAKKRSSNDLKALKEVIKEYINVCDHMSNHLLLIYQETQSLPQKWRKKVLENEVRITNIFVEVLSHVAESEKLTHMDQRFIEMMAHNIMVLGHMWTFRRWFLTRKYTLDEYIKFQTALILGLTGKNT
ncbi:MAG: TetR/AcrR family transcriptional regulator [Proteobacteria bacterium]|nr:TetR/AcrR family transcriptional regulator [Pseudomonadota bacterium]